MNYNKIILLLAIYLFLLHPLVAQTSTLSNNQRLDTFELTPEQCTALEQTGSGQFIYEIEGDISFSTERPFTAFYLKWSELSLGAAIQEIQYFDEDQWQILPFNHHIEKAVDARGSELGFLSKALDQYRIRLILEGEASFQLNIHLYNPGETKKSIVDKSPSSSTSICPCPPPEFQTRNEWCPNGDCPPNPAPAFTAGDFMIIHHSAGMNTSSDWPAVVRSIYNFHTAGNGWSDIGYNWLVDPEGVLYEGRGQGVLGAHFCGTNSSTMGVCMMGTYTDVTPPDTAVQTITELLAWNSCEENVDPLSTASHSGSGLNLFRISGHRDGCATECPGEAFYPNLPDIRSAVATQIASECTPLIVDMLVDTIFTSVETIVAGEEMLLRCRVTNNGNAILENVQVQYLIDGTLLYTDVVNSINAGASKNLTEAHTFPTSGTYEYCIRIDSISGEANLNNNDYCGTLSVDVNTATTDLIAVGMRIFPNPSTDVFHLENSLGREGQIRIYDNLGRLLLQQELNSEPIQEVDLSEHTTGVYLLLLSVGQETYTQKLLLH